MNTEWRPIPGAPGYEVSVLGWVRSWRRRRGEPRMLAATPDREGYPRIDARVDGRTLPMAVHRKVLEAFVGPAPKGLFALHRNRKRTDNRLSNLYWGTRSDSHIGTTRRVRK